MILSARAHPGETVGSWVMEGVLEFLTEESQEANLLRDKYVFRVLPMLNPDGVVNGNYRCGLLGVDLNRRWKKPNKLIHPVESHWKQLAKVFGSKRSIELVCDLHGHSRKLNTFMYGCHVFNEPQATRLFPYVLSKICPAFSYKDCTFGVHPSKETTLRVVMFKELKVGKVYTLETSFCGAETPSIHFTTSALKRIGRDLCVSLLISAMNSDSIPRMYGIPQILTRENALSELLGNDDLLHQGEDVDSSGSDSNPSDDDLPQETMEKFLPVKIKQKGKKQLRTLQRPQKPALFKSKSKSPVERLEQSAVSQSPNRSLDPVPSTDTKHRTGPTTPEQPPKAYYNIKGKRVRDQVTQTPVSFYLSYKLRRQGESFKIEEKLPRSPHVLTEKVQVGMTRIEASINRAKKSLLEDLSPDPSLLPQPSLSPVHKKAVILPQFRRTKTNKKHGRDLSFSFNSKTALLSPLDVSDTKFQLLAEINNTPKPRLRPSQRRPRA